MTYFTAQVRISHSVGELLFTSGSIESQNHCFCSYYQGFFFQMTSFASLELQKSDGEIFTFHSVSLQSRWKLVVAQMFSSLGSAPETGQDRCFIC